MSGRLYIALLHYPVLDRNGRVITSAVTNADIHDIARSARTYGVRRCFIVTPIAEQAGLVNEIIGHWTRGAGGTLNPSRREALEAVEVAGTLEGAVGAIDRVESRPVVIVATGARPKAPCVSYGQMRALLEAGTAPCLLLFGTGWGLADEIFERSRYRLEPIEGAGVYNHLSVRSAVAVTLDRLAGLKR
jgi:hypothetical protein